MPEQRPEQPSDTPAWMTPAAGVAETTQRGQLNAIVGKLVDTSGSQTTALAALVAAIIAKQG